MLRHFDLSGRRSRVEEPIDSLQRLGQAFNALGPIFQSFGGYLAARPDLLTAPDRAVFSNLLTDLTLLSPSLSLLLSSHHTHLYLTALLVQ